MDMKAGMDAVKISNSRLAFTGEVTKKYEFMPSKCECCGDVLIEVRDYRPDSYEVGVLGDKSKYIAHDGVLTPHNPTPFLAGNLSRFRRILSGFTREETATRSAEKEREISEKFREMAKQAKQQQGHRADRHAVSYLRAASVHEIIVNDALDAADMFQKEADKLREANKLGRLVDISVRNIGSPDASLVKLVRSIKENPRDTLWMQKIVATPHETLDAPRAILRALANPMIPEKIPQEYVAKVVSKDNFVEAVLEGVSRLVKR